MRDSNYHSQDYAKLCESSLIANADCDVYDYVAAAACGIFGGIVDIFIVDAPAAASLLRNGAAIKSTVPS